MSKKDALIGMLYEALAVAKDGGDVDEVIGRFIDRIDLQEDEDLSLVATSILIENLFDRYQSVVIVRSIESPKGDYQDHYLDYSAGRLNAIGQCEYAKHEMLSDCEGRGMFGGPA